MFIECAITYYLHSHESVESQLLKAQLRGSYLTPLPPVSWFRHENVFSFPLHQFCPLSILPGLLVSQQVQECLSLSSLLLFLFSNHWILN